MSLRLLRSQQFCNFPHQCESPGGRRKSKRARDPNWEVCWLDAWNLALPVLETSVTFVQRLNHWWGIVAITRSLFHGTCWAKSSCQGFCHCNKLCRQLVLCSSLPSLVVQVDTLAVEEEKNLPKQFYEDRSETSHVASCNVMQYGMYYNCDLFWCPSMHTFI